MHVMPRVEWNYANAGEHDCARAVLTIAHSLVLRSSRAAACHAASRSSRAEQLPANVALALGDALALLSMHLVRSVVAW